MPITGEPRDVFVSYSSKDRGTVTRVVGGLDARGCSTWFDQNDLQPFDASLSARISQGIASTRMTLAFVTDDYLRSDACKWELLQTLQTGGLDRLFVVADPNVRSHLALLSENMRLSMPSTPSARDTLVKSIVARLAQAPSVSAAEALCPDWWPDEWAGGAFTGRFDERLWLLDALTVHLGAREAINRAFDRAQVVGLGGQGKSLLALQYAKDFQTRYKTIARFDGGGDRMGGRLNDEAEFLDGMLGQVGEWAAAQLWRLGRKVELPERRSAHAWTQTRAIAAEIVAALDGQVLWLVDDLPSGLSGRAVQLLMCPGTGHTVVTTRRHDYDEHFQGATLSLHAMQGNEADFLLSGGDRSLLERDGDTLAEIAAEVDGHALALAVLARRIAAWSPRGVLDRLKGQPASAIAELERAALRIGGFPDGHAASIMTTLQMSIESLQESAARSILQLSTAWPTSLPIPFQLLDDVIGLDAIDGAHELVTAELAEKASEDTLKVHALVSGVAEHMSRAQHESDASAHDTELRARAARWLAPNLTRKEVWSAADDGRTAWHLLAPIQDALTEPDRGVAAKALLAMARLPMQHKPADLTGSALVSYLEEPLEYARLAESLRHGQLKAEVLDAGKAQAMQGLLVLGQASATSDIGTMVSLTRQAQRFLERSIQTRLPMLEGSALPEDQEELTRAYFNFGRLSLVLAKALSRTASAHDVGSVLNEADGAYSRARDAREGSLAGQADAVIDPDLHEDLGTCHRGLAIVAYTRTMYQGGLDPSQRSALLDEAALHLKRARSRTVRARSGLDLPEEVASADMAKDLQVSAKIALARRALQELAAGVIVQDLPLDEVAPALDANVAESHARELVPWGAVDPDGLGTGLPLGFIDLARLRVHESRGGRGPTAQGTLADFRDNDLPALHRVLVEGRQ